MMISRESHADTAARRAVPIPARSLSGKGGIRLYRAIGTLNELRILLYATTPPGRQKVQLVRFSLLSALMLVLSACSQSESQQQRLKSAASWTATAVFTLDAWLNGDVPSHYARRTTRAVQKHLSDLITDAQESESQATFQQQMKQTDGILDRAIAAIGASDRSTVEHSINLLEASAASFEKQGSNRTP
jgi:hypothetical protein